MTPQHVGPYEILEKLGSGGMATVFLGRHRETGLEAAVKVLPPSLARQEGFVERFAREVESMQRLSNPHIVKFYEAGEDHDTYFYAMEYVKGETLTNLIRREKKLSWQQSVDIAVQVCRALKSAHDAGVIHRDLKPSNLLIAEDGTVKLTDFGVAQIFAADRLTITGGIVGTAEFMSPEQAEGKRATKQSDLYSLGVLLYVMTTGRAPFSGGTHVELLQKHRFGRFDSPKLLTPEMPHWLDEIICQLLEKDPAKRFPNAFVLGRRLEQVVRKVELSRSDATQPAVDDSSDAQLDDDLEATLDSHGAAMSRGPGPGTVMKQLVRAELADIDAPSPVGRLFDNIWVLVGSLALLILGGVLWFRSGELPAEVQFERGVALMQHKEGPDWLRAKNEYFKPLLAEDRELWEPEVAPYLQQIELWELKRRALGRKKGRNVKHASEPERFLAQAQADHRDGRWAQALQKLEAVAALTANDPDQATLHEFSSALLDEWRAERQDDPSQYEWLQQALDRAQKLAGEGELEAARRIWMGVVELYHDDPAAAPYLKRAQQGLAQEQASHDG
ncbi:MAG TPA: serine/threonine-protein kinase [Planctomycetaceae bacterium]|nr:serine/threonine-protein kinase [Planctomycetaceae bacterium]